MYIKGTRKYADAILPKGAENSQAIDLLSHHLKYELNKRFSNSINKSQTNGNKNANGNGLNGLSKHKVAEFNGAEVFDKNTQQGKVLLPELKDHKCLKKILIEFLYGTKMPYYKIYMEIMINTLKKMINKEIINNILYSYSDTDEEITSKLSLVNKEVITVYEPILLVVDHKIKGILMQLNENANVKSIKIVSVYLYEDIILQLSEISNKISYISLYYGDGLKPHIDYILNGGFIGSDFEGEYQTVDYLFTRKNFDDMFKLYIK